MTRSLTFGFHTVSLVVRIPYKKKNCNKKKLVSYYKNNLNLIFKEYNFGNQGNSFSFQKKTKL